MTRSPRLRPSDLDDAQTALYDAIAGGPRATGPQAFALTDSEGRLNGPFDAMLLHPAVGGALQAVGSAIRFGGVLSARERELAIVVVAGAWDSGFELHAHRAVGRLIGLSDTELDAAAAGDATGFSGREQVVVLTAAALTSEHDLDDTGYDEAVRTLGDRCVYEITALVGYYATLALQLRVYRVEAPDGA